MEIRVSGARKAFGTLPALDDVDVTIPSGQLVALLGPSGSGKTTLLRVIAGIEAPDAGRVFFGDVDVTTTPVRERAIGFVFQDYALFDHMTVADNVAFGLSVRKAPLAEIETRVRELLAMVQLGHVADRMPRQLSGGQRQRIALARALAPRPKVLLLDEPFGALDARVRQELRDWLRRLHDDLHVTSVFVTHDQDEALEVADRIVVMNHGKVEQVGTPDDVFDEPASAFVMDFLGGANLIRGAVAGGVGTFGPLTVPIEAGGPGTGAARAYIRTTDLEVTREPAPGALAVQLQRVHRIGAVVRVEMVVDGPSKQPLVAELAHHDAEVLGLRVAQHANVRARRVRVFAER